MMKFTIEMLAARLKDLLAASRRERIPLEPARIACGALRGAQQRDYDDSTWQQIAVGDRWGGAGQTCWLRIPLRLPDAWAGHNVVVHIQLGDYESITGPEALAYLDGVPVQGFDFHHRELFLDERVSPAEEHLLALEAFSSLHQAPQTLRALELVRIDPEAEALYHDMRVLHGALLTMPPESIERARLLRALEHAYHALDMRRPLSDDYLRPVSEARAILQREVYAPEPAADSPRIVAVGHAHIDLAWLWPVAQTRRKGARTFSTVLKLMEQYPAYHFVASQPALYQMVREDEPALYARVKERIAEGRWEPTGATWVEMDCNVAGAEALVRQFLYGKRFFREELGADPKVLWLPDVFGYSAAMPQIMTGCGVDYFMTTKISWNEYNRLPHDTFRWRGIDGTEVLTHMVTAPLNPQEQFISTMQPFYTYNAKFTPYDVAGNWRAYREKAINDELLYLFGYGDGGGGPTETMQETAMRLAHLPGFPKVEQSSAEAFFRRLHERVWNDPDLPAWVGELYLEYHRGTYTSQGWIKRANRLSELLYREAELWAAAAGSLVDQTSWPAWQQELQEGWRSILFNQFHDILPGSSIGQVYSDAQMEYVDVARRGEAVRDGALDVLVAALASSEPALAVFNPAPFSRDDPVEVTLQGDADMPVVLDDAGHPVAVQAIDAPDGGRRVLVDVAAPALGYRLVSTSPSSAQAPEGASSGIHVEPKLLENRFFRLELDERATIVSLYDKRTGREVIAPGERGNQLLAFEDRPLNFDAWDINIYYADKPYPIDDVSSWRVVESGPLRGGDRGCAPLPRQHDYPARRHPRQRPAHRLSHHHRLARAPDPVESRLSRDCQQPAGDL